MIITNFVKKKNDNFITEILDLNRSWKKKKKLDKIIFNLKKRKRIY
jgi:hypothetical protein